MEIRIINNLDDFASLKEDWNSLLENSTNQNIFLTWEWMYEWYVNLAEGKSLYIVTIRENKKLIGIAPFVKHENKVLHLTILEFLGSYYVCSDFLDLVVNKENPEGIINELFLYLSKEDFWDIIKLKDMNVESKNFSIIFEKSGNFNIEYKEELGAKCPYIILPSTMDEFFLQLSRNTRYKLKKSDKLLKKFFNYKIVLVKDKNSLDQILHYMFNINFTRWNKDYSKGSFFNENVRNFTKNITKRFLENGTLFFAYLEINNKLIAYCYDFAFMGTIYGYSTTYDINFEGLQYSPGRVLKTNLIKEAIENKYKEYNLLRGEERYKYTLTDKYRQLASIILFKKSIRSFIYFSYENMKKSFLLICRKTIPQKLRFIIGEKILRG